MKYICLITLTVVFASCSEENNEQVSEFADLPPFSEIQVNHVFHIFLQQDTSFSIRISGNREIIEGVRYIVENGVLTLTNESGMMWIKPENHKVELWIRADRLKKVTINEASFVETANPIITEEFGLVTGNKYAEAKLELDNAIFYFWNNFPCGGKLTLMGNTQSLRIWNYVIMSVDARHLAARNALIDNYSKGDCIVNVQEKIEYSIHGTGNIYLYGDPEEIILQERTGSGQLIRMP
jgi:hypothetical protein